MPKTYAVGEVPAGGWSTDTDNDPSKVEGDLSNNLISFNQAYSEMLVHLQWAWRASSSAESGRSVAEAIKYMRNMTTLARKIVKVPLPDGSGWHYCPEFRFTQLER